MKPDLCANEHIISYLNYYVDFPHPQRTAILLNGPWGVGKTHLVRKYMRQAKEHGKICVYISLFGLSTVQEFDEALLRAIYPVIDSKVAEFTGRIVGICARFFRLENPIKASDIVEASKTDLIIFDDLERCLAPLNTILGYINSLVEHEGRKVVIVANEKEIADCAVYKVRREKLIGKLFEVQSSFNEAFFEFVRSIQTESLRNFFLKKAEDILKLYNQSGLNNLRILQQSMWDFERLYGAMSEIHIANEEAMTAALRMFFGLSFEYKSGRIYEEDLINRPDAIHIMIKNMDKETASDKSRIEISIERYKSESIIDTMLSNKNLVDIISESPNLR